MGPPLRFIGVQRQGKPSPYVISVLIGSLSCASIQANEGGCVCSVSLQGVVKSYNGWVGVFFSYVCINALVLLCL